MTNDIGEIDNHTEEAERNTIDPTRVGFTFNWDDFPEETRRRIEDKIAEKALEQAPTEMLIRQVVTTEMSTEQVTEGNFSRELVISEVNNRFIEPLLIGLGTVTLIGAIGAALIGAFLPALILLILPALILYGLWNRYGEGL